jgi:hypothetical protein
MMGEVSGADYNIYQMTFFIGWPLAATIYVVISRIFPPSGLGISEGLAGYDEDEVIEGLPAKENLSSIQENGKEVTSTVAKQEV